MATHGKAREVTINALRNCTPFARKGFGMQGIEGVVYETGRLNSEYVNQYRNSDIAYTVVSYATPIAWVTNDGEVVVPDAKYSVTTTHHQSLCKVYLNKCGIWQ